MLLWRKTNKPEILPIDMLLHAPMAQSGTHLKVAAFLAPGDRPDLTQRTHSFQVRFCDLTLARVLFFW